jgi:hypothetical protein
MKRHEQSTAAALVAAAFALHFASPATTAQVPAETIVAVGCVNPAVQNGSLAGAPGVPPASPTTAAVEANVAAPTGAFLLKGTTAPRQATATRGPKPTKAPGDTYVLDGAREQFEPHVGHQVEVTGKMRIASEGPAEEKNIVKHIQVASIKMVASKCLQPSITPD